MQVTRKPGVCLCGCGAELPVPRPCNARLATDACRKKRELEREKAARKLQRMRSQLRLLAKCGPKEWM